MNANFGTVLDRENWEARIINEDPFSAIPRTSLAKREFVVRDKITNQSVSLPAIGALDILTDTRQVENWKKNGIVIGIPALRTDSEKKPVGGEEILYTPFVREQPEFILSVPLRLTREQSKDLFDFLQENEQLLRELAEKDAVIAKQQMTALFAKIAEYGRRKRQNRSE